MKKYYADVKFTIDANFKVESENESSEGYEAPDVYTEEEIDYPTCDDLP